MLSLVNAFNKEYVIKKKIVKKKRKKGLIWKKFKSLFKKDEK